MVTMIDYHDDGVGDSGDDDDDDELLRDLFLLGASHRLDYNVPVWAQTIVACHLPDNQRLDHSYRHLYISSLCHLIKKHQNITNLDIIY